LLPGAVGKGEARDELAAVNVVCPYVGGVGVAIVRHARHYLHRLREQAALANYQLGVGLGISPDDRVAAVGEEFRRQLALERGGAGGRLIGQRLLGEEGGVREGLSFVGCGVHVGFSWVGRRVHVGFSFVGCWVYMWFSFVDWVRGARNVSMPTPP